MGARTVSANRVGTTSDSRSTASQPGNRIVVVGSTGAGKTTVARTLSASLGIPHVELDELNFAPGWTMASREEFRTRVAEAVTADRWVVDGNYGTVRDIVWARADTIVWLDFGIPTVWWRLLRRTSYRILTRQELWHGNRETLRNQFRRDNLFLWALRHRKLRRPEYLRLLTTGVLGDKTVIHLRSPRQTRRWVSSLGG